MQFLRFLVTFPGLKGLGSPSARTFRESLSKAFEGAEKEHGTYESSKRPEDDSYA